MCCCSSDALCEICLSGRFAQLRGVAACRAHQWVLDLSQRISGVQRPTGSAKMLGIARLKIADLGRDERLLDMLARECAAAAEREWRVVATGALA
jgi:hypothetical protein